MEKKERVFIYRIYFPESDKCYIGQTNNLKKRMIDHIKCDKSLISRALFKYDVWKISVLHTCKSRDEANRVEIEEIRNFDSVTPNGYNITRGGNGCSGFEHSEESKAKMSMTHIGAGHTVETRNRISESTVGYEKTAEHCENLSYALKGNKNRLGREHSDDTIAKMRESKLGDRNPMFGKKRSAESSAKMFITKRTKTIAKTVSETFGLLKAVEHLPEMPGNHDWYRCICACGNEKNIRGSSLRAGSVRSCGCLITDWSETSKKNHLIGQRIRRYKEYQQKIQDLEAVS